MFDILIATIYALRRSETNLAKMHYEWQTFTFSRLLQNAGKLFIDG